MTRTVFKTKAKDFFHSLFLSFLPNRRDNVKQLLLKIFFLLSLVTFITAAVVISSYFLEEHHEDAVLQEARNIWYAEEDTEETPDNSAFAALKAENSDFTGWLTIPGTQVDNPVYQTTDDSYYLDHNSKKEKSRYGALFFSSKNEISSAQTDQNLIIYGHNMKNGSMFGSLKELRSLPFLREHGTVELTTENRKTVYKIYAVFVLNARKADDDGYIYNLFRKNFRDDEDFQSWVDEAKQRSLIRTDLDVRMDDSLLTLVTCANDFENARLVVMARELHEDETASDPSDAEPNPSPRYPKIWYDNKKQPYPYSGGQNDVS